LKTARKMELWCNKGKKNAIAMITKKHSKVEPAEKLNHPHPIRGGGTPFKGGFLFVHSLGAAALEEGVNGLGGE